MHYCIPSYHDVGQMPLCQCIITTATVFFRQFYIKNLYCETDPFIVIAACCYVATKAEESPVHIKSVVSELRLMFSHTLPVWLYFTFISHVHSQIDHMCRGGLQGQELPVRQRKACGNGVLSHERLGMRPCCVSPILHPPHSMWERGSTGSGLQGRRSQRWYRQRFTILGYG